jgi:hypothetical protein
VVDRLRWLLTLSALGLAISNLASLYSAHGWHQDALVINKDTLELRRRVLPANLPDIGAACVNAGACYLAAGDSHVREVLRILQSTLPPSHPHIQKAQQLMCRCESDAMLLVACKLCGAV